MKNANNLCLALAQIAPVWLNKQASIEKIVRYINKAGKKKCDLVCFGEALLPGYPFWLSITNASKFDNKKQKEIHAHYIENAVQIEQGDLNSICTAAKKNKIAVYLGIIERAQNRGNHSLYCSLVYIDKQGKIQSVHRKLQPTYEERLCWSSGDGNGLQVHPIKKFTVGGLNCWENWMPLVRSSLYAQGENLHIAVWPGAKRNTLDITRFIAQEARSFVASVSGLLRLEDIPKNTPHYKTILKSAPTILANGGSCIAGPDGKWIQKPIINKETLIIQELNIQRVFEERQNFDPSGHYSRPDITQLIVDRQRQSILKFKDQ